MKISLFSFAIISIGIMGVFLGHISKAQEYELDDIEQEYTSEYTNALQEGIPFIPRDEFFRARVIDVVEESVQEMLGGYIEEIQVVDVRILDGKEKGRIIRTTYGGVVGIDQYHKVKAGDTVVLVKLYKYDGTHSYFINDFYRLNALIIIFIAFVLLVVFYARLKGIGSLLGLSFSVLILAKFIVPQIISGANPLTVTLIGTFVIAVVTLYLAHGFNKRTSLALLSTLTTLIIALGISQVFVDFALLFGRGSEDAFYLQIGNFGTINLKGLLLAGIVIGTLGLLDDITTAQTAVVGELRRANPLLSISEIYHRALIVGREHITSLVNTLVLAYAGASLPLFILFTVNTHVPMWVKLNGELIAEEFVRSIIGSMALVLAVPIATFFAAYLLKHEKTSKDEGLHAHHHHHHH